MDIRELVPIVSKVAPILGSLLGSPMAGLVISMIASHYGVGQSFNIQTLSELIKANPEDLRRLEYQHKEEMTRLILGFIQQSEAAIPRWVVVLFCLLGMCAAIFYFWYDISSSYVH